MHKAKFRLASVGPRPRRAKSSNERTSVPFFTAAFQIGRRSLKHMAFCCRVSVITSAKKTDLLLVRGGRPACLGGRGCCEIAATCDQIIAASCHDQYAGHHGAQKEQA
jgi:hypothetical protein